MFDGIRAWKRNRYRASRTRLITAEVMSVMHGDAIVMISADQFVDPDHIMEVIAAFAASHRNVIANLHDGVVSFRNDNSV